MDTVKKTLLLIPAAIFDHQSGLEAVYDPSEPYPYARPTLLHYTFIILRLLSTCFLLPIWWLLLALRIQPKPRPSWSIAHGLLVSFTRRASGVSDLAGVRWGVRDPQVEPRSDRLRETRFEWMDGLSSEARVGVLKDRFVQPRDQVGCYVWEEPQIEGGLVGIYVHGGSYLHQSAHESAITSAIPRRLMTMGCFESIYSVEYRLLPFPFPAALQDLAAVYCTLIHRGIAPSRIALVGDLTGGGIILSLARWIRDESVNPRPAGLLLLSPWCDPSFSFPTSFEFYDPRPHPEDYLSDHPQARLHLVSSLLGPNRDHSSLRDPYISPAASPIPHGSFHSFPPTFLHYGDAERLEPEIDRLARAMRRDGVAVSVEKTRDAVHDVLILWLWDENVKGKIWRRIEGWLKQLEDSAEGVEGEK